MSDEIKEDHEDTLPSNYIRVISHQLKSPIDSIQSLLNTISGGFTGETNPKTLYFIEKAVNRISEAKENISDLLDYELYSQNQLSFQEEVEFVLLINELVSQYAPRAGAKRTRTPRRRTGGW